MIVRSVWLLHHKALLSEESLMNLDGSAFLTGVAVVPVQTMHEALLLFDAYLDEQKMMIMDLWKCEKWNPKNHDISTLEGRQVNNASEKCLETNLIHYTCGISSEALDCGKGSSDWI
jgi:hypothetical protein